MRRILLSFSVVLLLLAGCGNKEDEFVPPEGVAVSEELTTGDYGATPDETSSGNLFEEHNVNVEQLIGDIETSIFEILDSGEYTITSSAYPNAAFEDEFYVAEYLNDMGTSEYYILAFVSYDYLDQRMYSYLPLLYTHDDKNDINVLDYSGGLTSYYSTDIGILPAILYVGNLTTEYSGKIDFTLYNKDGQEILINDEMTMSIEDILDLTPEGIQTIQYATGPGIGNTTGYRCTDAISSLKAELSETGATITVSEIIDNSVTFNIYTGLPEQLSETEKYEAVRYDATISYVQVDNKTYVTMYVGTGSLVTVASNEIYQSEVDEILNLDSYEEAFVLDDTQKNNFLALLDGNYYSIGSPNNSTANWWS